MYGLIHSGFREYVREHLGDDIWESIIKQRDLSEEYFISMSSYPDNVTIGMIVNAANISGMTFDKVLEEFGEYWISYMGQGEYAPMMNFAGSDFISFMTNLNRIHDAVKISISGAKTPSFDIIKVNNKSIVLRYVSDRSGLLPFVRGLIAGLFKRFNIEGESFAVKRGKKFTQIKIVIR